MKPYFIFAIVLTVAYLVYYAVVIVQDLYGKKGTDKTDEEVFDLGVPEEEESVAVAEKLARLKAKAEEQMEETVPYLSDAYTTDELYRAMIAGGKTDNRPELEWKPLKDHL